MSGTTDDWSEPDGTDKQLLGGEPRDRGQSRGVLGLIVLVIVGPPLLGAAWKIQQSLAATGRFPWWAAVLIAVLIVGLVTAAIFDVE